ncbi:NDP-glycosyltransferase YjiC-like isoform X1 [Panonychus citri]|uniref:NDP-glycosyltransferase YjiC-like isoform X1 n=2 Tax=Panonychus citri TaxID=50023 RepID=UPI00230750EF|nr:NDP-glycosyltransferase YjiC-like isoform X1 [Panonychus citri]
MVDTMKPLNVLITASRGIGHVNASMGIGKLMVDRGHNVMFIHYPEHKSLAENQGIKFIDIFDYQEADDPLEKTHSGPFNDSSLETFDNQKKYSPKDLMRGGGRGRGGNRGGGGPRGGGRGPMFSGENAAIENAMKVIKPDVVLGDYRWVMGFMTKCPCPFIPVMSNGPVSLYNGPPIGSGLSVFDAPEKWAEARENGNDMMKEMAIRVAEGKLRSWTHAEYLGIYIFPEALDYKELGPVNKNWVRLDQSIRLPELQDFELPDKLKDKPGKLVYVSMGTNASNDPTLIKMLVDACAKSPNRFIFALGRNGHMIQLPGNVWGDNYVKQLSIIPKVDLVITHCGSNSLVESLYFGKPMVAIPIFDDQLDNGQRVADLKLGKKINLSDFTEEKLVQAIDQVLGDQQIHDNVIKVSEEMKKSQSSDKIPVYIEFVARNKKSPFE